MTSVAGFGLADRADGYLFRPTSSAEIWSILAMAQETNRQVVLRGAGRSYGDASVAPEAIILDIARLNRILSWDPETGIIEVEAGVTLEQIWRHCLEDGYWLPVVSGTMYPTIAGALAMNIHGKNNFRMGTLGEHVISLTALFPYGEERTLTPDQPFFPAVISGAGLLGVITQVKLQMKRVTSGDLRVLPVSCANWDEQFATFDRLAGDADYIVSWVDAFARGKSAGRGLIHAAWHQHGENPATLRPEHQDLPDTILGFLPKSVTWRLLKPFNNRLGMRMINAAKYRASRLLGNGKPHDQSLVGFSFLLDYVPNWRQAYAPHGLMQYQSFVPREAAAAVCRQQLEWQQEAGLVANLAVLKRHRPDRFLLSHGVDGYSLALDFRLTSRNQDLLRTLCHRMNDLVLESGGRFYLAKDRTLRPEDFRRSIGDPAMQAFQDYKRMLDPDSILTSALAKRLELMP